MAARNGETFGKIEIESCMGTVWAGRTVSYWETIDSTNLQAKREAEAGAAHGTLVAADMQTAGRGRRGRGWQSPAGCNVYFTLLLKPDYEPDKAHMITLVMALAVAEGIYAACGLEAQIKWPNDIVLSGKKVCGILTEMSAEQGHIRHVVVGVGINVGQQDFPPEVSGKATSLQAECGKAVSRAALLGKIMQSFEQYYDRFSESLDLSCIQKEYGRLLANRDREVLVLDPKGEFSGVARGIDQAGELLVELPEGGIVNVYAGEVSVRGLYGYV